MSFVELKPRALALMRSLSSDYSDEYVEDSLLPGLSRELDCSCDAETVRQRLLEPYHGLRTLYGFYAFQRRGKDRHELSGLALKALSAACRESAFSQFLALTDGDLIWQSYLEVCRREGRKPLEQLNRGVLVGLAELAQEIYQLDGTGSIVNWIVAGANLTSRLEPQFLRIVDIRGVGPKVTSVLLRDVVYLYNLESRIDPVDRLYVQPIDKWLRLVAPHVIEEPGIEDAADWVLAGKLAKYTRRAGVSGVRFNMGVSAFGARHGASAGGFSRALEELLA